MNDVNSIFKEYLSKIVSVVGVQDLVKYLVHDTDYFKAPASTRFHSDFENGLVYHSCAVVRNILSMTDKFDIKWDRPESPYIIGLFHDLCKTNFYSTSFRNVKSEETGKWEKVPYYLVDDKEPLGHGVKSVIIIQKYLKLTEQEIMCIAWHMGAFGDNEYRMNYSNACDLYPEIMLVALADQLAGVNEKRVQKLKLGEVFVS